MQLSDLKQLGLSKNQAKVYLAALESGPATIAYLSRKSGVQRSTIYEFMQEMIDKEVIKKTISGKRNLFAATNPEELTTLIEKQKQTLNRIMPELLSMAQKSPAKPKFILHEGLEGIKNTLNDTLNIPDGSEILYFASYKEAFEALPSSFIKSYLKKRVAKNIKAKGILPSEKEVKPFVKANKQELRETITISKKDFPVKNEILIYANKVAIIAYGQEKLGLIIESNQIADSQKAVFNLLWKLLK